ncbi:protein HOMOLOG OF MAMMALIAN LYST-INTERACTING PROTEIN 5-like [Zingiber officinale]|uniref:protein HOMOLOG OF MAMMALIAN LYST-INTERACTING PROTEIN 5-like n=1 Tax=Zingiber officinale TaxID=94328 RepID=UPI001C4BC714|nr:protein HOMOLOG OF MAMMALIAN LYST-INTERACTING PROTEIN 5-like [Zingiber officinale]
MVDAPSAYNVILGQPALNEFQAVVSTYCQKIKFLVDDRVGEVKGDQLAARRCYVEMVKTEMRSARKNPCLEVNAITERPPALVYEEKEKDKKSLQLGPEDNLYVEGFASNLFAKEDKQDRAGRADLNIAKTFYAASIFFEILYQFGELQPEKYAVWKAADIRKALKEGRKPEPGPPGGDPDQSISSGLSSYTYGTQPSDGLSASQQFDNASPQHIHKVNLNV